MTPSDYHFLFCLPIRLGALLITLLSTAIGLFLGVTAWIAVARADKTNTPEIFVHTLVARKVIYSVEGIMYTVYGVVSLIGLVGVIKHKIKLVKMFSYSFKFFLGLMIILGIVEIVFYAISDQPAKCTEIEGRRLCEQSSRPSTGAVALYAFLTILQLVVLAYCCWIISDCVVYIQERLGGPGPYGRHPYGIGNSAPPSRTEAEETIGLQSPKDKERLVIE